jgi:hypothetical protein
MMRSIFGKLAFILANVFVMIILHGNSKQFWPKIPFLSLKNESVAEHSRLLFNTLLVVSVGQLLVGKLPAERRLPRLVVLLAMPAALPLLIFFGQRVLKLEGEAAERYNLGLVPLLPIGAMILEDRLTSVQALKHSGVEAGEHD